MSGWRAGAALRRGGVAWQAMGDSVAEKGIGWDGFAVAGSSGRSYCGRWAELRLRGKNPLHMPFPPDRAALLRAYRLLLPAWNYFICCANTTIPSLPSPAAITLSIVVAIDLALLSSNDRGSAASETVARWRYS